MEITESLSRERAEPRAGGPRGTALLLSALVGCGLFAGLYCLDRGASVRMPIKAAVGLAGGVTTFVVIRALGRTPEQKKRKQTCPSGSRSAEISAIRGSGCRSAGQTIDIEPDRQEIYAAEDLATYQPRVMQSLHRKSQIKRPLRLDVINARKTAPARGEVEVIVKDPIPLKTLESARVKQPKTRIECRTTPFETVGPNVWWPNFSDTHLGCGWQGTLGAQEEMLFEQSHQLQQLHQRAVVEKDRALLTTRSKRAGPGGRSKSILFRGLSKDCRIDLGRTFPHPTDPSKGKITIYGDWFERHPVMPYAKMKEMSLIEILDEPEQFNVFCMTAPNCRGRMGKPIGRDHIADLGSTAITSYCLLAQTSEERQTVFGGWWGAGVFKNPPIFTAVIQMTAAQVAGVDYVHHDFPVGRYAGQWRVAEQIFLDEISPLIEEGCTVGALWDRISDLAAEHDWKCLKRNPVPDTT